MLHPDFEGWSIFIDSKWSEANPFPRSPSQLCNHYAVPGLFTERYSDLARAQQLQFYCGYIPAHSPHSAPTDGKHLLGKVGGAFASTGHFAGRCVRKVLETQK